jgi:eukaryotic-like serine/threonine-protein kinase
MAEESRYCPDCGRQVGGRRFCPFCGSNVAPGPVDAAGDTTINVGEPSVTERVTIIVEAHQGGGHQEESPGRSFGRYRVVREAGRGAMGVVYLARDDRIGRDVAIKSLLLAPGLSPDARKHFSERFEREARAAGRLSHPNIVTVHDVGEEAGSPYMAMEYLEGATLTELTGQGPLSIKQATDIVTQVLAALEYAHAHDVVHRDIKPDNVFVLPDGTVKVADFGIARLSGDSTMTQVGQVIGTPGYMSPEQVNGEAVGPASDIFSAGVLLYELLTGVEAFSSTSITSLMYKIVHEEPTPPHLVNPGIPPYLEAVIARSCEKDPARRYASAAEMREDIEMAREPARPAGRVAFDGTVLRSEALPAQPQTVIHDSVAPSPGPPPVGAPAGAAPPGAAATAPAKKRTGLWVAIGALAALVVVGIAVAVVLLAVPHGNNGKDGGTTTTGEKPRPPAVTDLNNFVSAVSASSVLQPDVPGISYVPDNVRDNVPDTAWSEGVPGYGEGQYLDFTFDQPVVIKDVRAIPGYKRFNQVDRYIQNGKLDQVTLTFQDGSTRTVTFRLDPNWQVADWQTVPIDPPARTRTVRVTILSVYPGQDSGKGAATDTTVSEFHFQGFTAAEEDSYNEKLKQYESSQKP